MKGAGRKVLSLVLAAAMVCGSFAAVYADQPSDGQGDSGQDSGALACICTQPCAEGAVNGSCPVCSAAGVDLAAVCLGAGLQVTGWEFVQNPVGFILREEGGLFYADAPRGGLTPEDLASLLPQRLAARVAGVDEPVEVAIAGWLCPGYVADAAGAWPASGEFTFTAQTPDGYRFSSAPAVTVRILSVATLSVVSGWNADKTVYTVIGQDGWQEKSIEVTQDCLLDLSRAEAPAIQQKDGAWFIIRADDVTVTVTTGEGDEPLDTGNKPLVRAENCINPTLLLDAANITGVGELEHSSQTGAATTFTLRYQGQCTYPPFQYYGPSNVPDRENIFRIEAVTADSVLTIPEAHGQNALTTSQMIAVEIVGGTIRAEGIVRAKETNNKAANQFRDIPFDGSMRVESCTLTCDALFAREITIEDAQVTTTEPYNQYDQFSTKGMGIVGGVASYGADNINKDFVDVGFVKISNSTIDSAGIIGCDTSDTLFDKSKTSVEIEGSVIRCLNLTNAATIHVTDSDLTAVDEEGTMDAAIGSHFKEMEIVDSVVYAYVGGQNSSAIGKGKLGAYYSQQDNDDAVTEYTITLRDSEITAISEGGNAIGSTIIRILLPVSARRKPSLRLTAAV